MTREAESVPTFTPDSVRRAPVLHRLRGVLGGSRGSAQLGVLVAAAAVAGGLVIGSGVAAHAAKSGYNLAWLSDGKRGQVVQVDPVVGRTNVRLQVAKPGDTLDITQGDGRLVVVDRTTGRITSIDLGTLLVSGNRTGPSGAAVKVLLDGQRMYLANLPSGSVQAVDPQSEATIGTPWAAGDSLVDVGIDGQHHVWALSADQVLTTLAWKPSTATLTPIGHRVLTGTGPGSVIVGHPRGVTVVGAGGTIARVGTGHDSTMTSPQVRGRLSAPASSPDGLVPVADPGNSSVVIVGGNGAVVDQVSALGCPTPGSPVVFDGKIYVPCLGSGLVVVLDQSGHQAADPIHTPGGGDPQLTVSDGHLLVSAPGSTTASVIDGSGDTRTFPTVDPSTPVQNPSQPPPSPPAPPPATPPHHGNNPGDQGGGGNTGGTPSGAPSTGSSTPTAPAPDHGGGTATASARPDGTVLVSWTGPRARGGYTVTSGGTSVAQVPDGASSATVTVLAPGTTTTLVVHAFDSGGRRERWSATTNEITTSGGASVTVTDVNYQAAAPSGGFSTLSVSWTGPVADEQISYTLTSSTTTVSATTATTQTTLDVPCTSTCSGTLTVTPQTPAGPGTPTQKAFTVSAVAPTPPPSQPPTHPTQSSTPPRTTAAPPPSTTAPPALPAAGATVLAATATLGRDSTGVPATVTVTITTPADWATWTGGTCSLLEDGAVTTPTVPCNASGQQRSFDYYETGSHTYLLRATATDGRTVDSAAATITARYIFTPGCPNQFVHISGITTQLPNCQPCYNGGGRICPAPPFTAPIAGLEPTLRLGWFW